MFDIGFQELAIIFLVALLVVGPKNLPEVARTLGKWMSELRRGFDSAKIRMESEFRESEKMMGEEAKMGNGSEEGISKKTQTGEERQGEG